MSPASNDEWSALAQPYEDVFRPRFEPLYRCMADAVVERIRSTKVEHPVKLLDYGTGSGEPVLTILKILEANELFNVELHGLDSSEKMLSIAVDRLEKLKTQQLTVRFSALDDPSNDSLYDIITMSLVLPYATDKAQMLRERANQLKPKGLLITSHWANPRSVPFLVTVKGVVGYMAKDEKIDLSKLESDASFSCWREEETRQLFEAEGFIVHEWTPVHLPMSFPNVRALLRSCAMCSWFNDETLCCKAEEEAKRILREIYGLEIDFNEAFQLPSTAVVVVASKSS